MQLLCLTDRAPADALPSLELLVHDLRVSPLGLRLPPAMRSQYDCIIVDGSHNVRLAREVCKELASTSCAPRIAVLPESALGVVQPDWGVSDVLLPGAGPAEIELRLRLLRPAVNVAEQGAQTEVHAAGVVIDEANFTARLHGRPLDLTYKEFELLYFLVAHPERVFTREQLLSEVWGTDYFGGTRTVDVHVRRLRAKLGEHDGLISTVRGVGYGFARARDTPEDDHQADAE
ncbi:DNA-binding response OmpR family regulator [Leucobacter exalbidus]|uniref:DNA-binding response OmpR family regulator n=1 Tax=Leucobacter exalbidus TaxID=662960 RepID=A0A940T1T0_9MICO|nr:response regulator transcription factor [Leucobacter exalbidus]MBP1327165.1 DNA-binding response OmpR family regulator [Leucobacter exalbidus]